MAQHGESNEENQAVSTANAIADADAQNTYGSIAPAASSEEACMEVIGNVHSHNTVDQAVLDNGSEISFDISESHGASSIAAQNPTRQTADVSASRDSAQ